MKSKDKKEKNLDKIKRILIVNPFGIGDVLFTTPLIKTLRELYPNNYIGFLCNRRTSYILENNPLVDEVFVFEKDEYRHLWKTSKIGFFKDFFKLLKSLKKRQFDICFDFSLNSQYGFFLKRLKIPIRAGYNYRNRGKFLTDKITINGYHYKHVVEFYLNMATFLGIKTHRLKNLSLEFYINQNDVDWADDFQREYLGYKEKFVCICPAGGESWGEDSTSKHWPPEKYSDLINKITSELKVKVVILSSAKERRIVARVKNLIEDRKNIIDLSGRTTLGQLAACIKRASVFISNDGGPIHIAKALGVPTVSIFGPVNEKVYGPYPASSLDKVIKADMSCRPCYQYFKFPECKHDKNCLSSIKTDRVFEAVKDLLYAQSRKT